MSVQIPQISDDQVSNLITTEYDVGRPTLIRPLRLARNHTYEIATDRGRHVLRIRGGNDWWIDGQSDLLFELDLLDHLAQHGIPVSTAIPRRGGDRLGVLATDDDHGGGDGRTYSLFTWAPGRIGSRTPDGARLVGAALARIHLAADRFATDHSRYRLDETTMLDRRLPGIEQGFPDLPAADVRTIRTHIEEIRRRLRTFDPGPGGWGIIHGDVQELNFTIDEGTVTFFDFELCAWGWRTADVAEYYTRISPPQREPFLAGYQSVRPLNPSERDMLLTIGRLAWIREGCVASDLAHMLRDPFIRFHRDQAGRWQMRAPGDPDPTADPSRL